MWLTLPFQIQCAGEAFYSDDLPAQPYEVFAAFTLTTVGSGDIVSINPKKALVNKSTCLSI